MALQESSEISVPLDIQYLVLESADWDDHPILAQVCSTWKKFLQTSHIALDKRYESIHDVFPTMPSDDRWSTPKIHRALSKRYITLRSGFKFEFCHWTPLGTDLYRSQGTIHQEAASFDFFSNDPAMRLPLGPGDVITVATRRAEAWFQHNINTKYPMACDSGGRIPTVGLLLHGARAIAHNGYIGGDYVPTLLKYWVRSFYSPVVLGISWRIQYIAVECPPYLDLRFDIQEIGTGRVEGAVAYLLRGVSPFFTPCAVVFLRTAFAFRTKAAVFVPALQAPALTAGMIVGVACTGLLLALLFST
ncbi:hypothetical protein TWF506_007549 [Arthrobotrys conoides]|uniref:F-box domain-containing protein n=1 Tax=Arthrobotrys conoides TaxID=74498 RepID=A0AAN8RY51_9PEZI